MGSIAVLLVDKNQSLLRILPEFLQKASRDVVEAVGTAATGREAIAQASATHPDVVVVDPTVRDLPTVDLLPRLRRERLCVILVVLTLQDQEQYRRAAFEAGADAFVSKMKAAEELWPTIRDLVAAKRGPA